MAQYRLFMNLCRLTPAAQEKVRKERASSPGTTPEIKYRREKVVEDREFENVEALLKWVSDQAVPMEGLPEVLVSYVEPWGFLENPTAHEAKAKLDCFMSTEQELPL